MKQVKLIIILALFLAGVILAQESADKMPFPVDGIKGIAENVVYPEKAKEAKVEGKVFIKALISTEGKVISASVEKGIGYGCDEAALEAVKMTEFTPGESKGKKVEVEITIPVMFKLS